MQNPRRPFGLAVGVISLTMAIGNLAALYGLGFTFLFLGPMAFCGALVALSHGSWRIGSVAGFLALCSSVLAFPGYFSLKPWQLILFFGAVVAGFLLGCLLLANYRSDRNLEKRPYLAAWLAGMQSRPGMLLVGSSLAMGLIVWLQFDLASCSLYSGHLAERFSSTRNANAFLAPAAFLTGTSAIACGHWRSGLLAAYVSLGALVANFHATGDPINGELALLAAPLSLFFWPLLSAPLHSLYGPWISVTLAAILFASWRAGKVKQSD